MINNSPYSTSRGLARRTALFLACLLAALLFLLFLSGPSAAQEPLEPPAPPDAQSGLPVYGERCANCHGPLGQGDGELAANLPVPPRDFSDPAYLRNAIPATMYQVITEGLLNQGEGMPPFGPASSNPIPEDVRWDLVATVYSLGTDPAAVERGQAVYSDNCLACHGEGGAGDGPEADPGTAVTDLTDLRYWANRSNEMVFTTLQDETIAAHTYELEEAALRDVVDYSRTFSYGFVDPQAAAAPIEAANISGLVLNGTTGEPLTEGTVLLRAFTADLQEADTNTTEIGPDGRFSFDLADVSPDWVFLASTEFGDLSFSSNPNRLERLDPDLDMPITVYETTTNPAAVNINQVHMLLDFVNDRLLVSEIYVLSNREPAVFVGASGDSDQGTLEIRVPEGAENVEFQRSFRSFESFLPATEVIPTAEGFADTVPVRPGDGAMNLLVTYDLPYQDGMSLDHQILYETANATVVMPDAGVALQGENWQTQGVQQMGTAGSVLSYARPGLAAGDTLAFTLNGRPERTAAAARVGGDGGAGAFNETASLLLGGAIFLLTIGGAAYALNTWRSAEPPQTAEGAEIEQLLQAVVNLDDAYEAGQLDEAAYAQRRTALITELAALWPRPAQTP